MGDGLFGGNRQQLSFRVGLPVQHLRLQAETDIGRGNALFNVLALLLDKGGTQARFNSTPRRCRTWEIRRIASNE